MKWETWKEVLMASFAMLSCSCFERLRITLKN